MNNKEREQPNDRARALRLIIDAMSERDDIVNCSARALDALVALGWKSPSSLSAVRAETLEEAKAIAKHERDHWEEGTEGYRVGLHIEAAIDTAIRAAAIRQGEEP